MKKSHAVHHALLVPETGDWAVLRAYYACSQRSAPLLQDGTSQPTVRQESMSMINRNPYLL